MKPRKLTKGEVEITITPEEEDRGPEGEFSSGDPEADAELVHEIHERLARGDLWAWCTVKVEARFGQFYGTAYLGGCSYEHQASFMEGGYYEQMVGDAVDDLNQNIARQLAEIAPLLT